MKREILLPERLHTGDKIGIVSPSGPVKEEQMVQFDAGVNYLKALGFEVKLAKNALSNTMGYSATPEEKGEDINTMFADKDIKAIICSQGGANANSCLPYINWDTIVDNPKIFLGISDISVLINAIHHQTGLVTFHGNDIMWGFGTPTTDYDRSEFLNRLVHGQIGPIESNSKRKTIRGGYAEGKLLGGNIHCILKLAGTPYNPDYTGCILFLESFGFSPEDCACLISQLIQNGVMDRINGVIIGYIYDEQSHQRSLFTEDILLNMTRTYDFPILKINDFGHNCPNTVIPIGVRASLDADKQEIILLDNCVY